MCSRTQRIAAAATAAVVGQFHLYGAVTVASSIDAALFDGHAVSVIGSAAAAGASTAQGAPNTRWTEVVQNIGVRLGKAEQVDFGRGIRSYGLVQENERLVSEITARVEGWVEDLSVTAVGDDV